MASTDNKPVVGRERGSVYDMVSQRLLFNDTEVYDFGEPSVEEIEQMLQSRDGQSRGLAKALTLPIQGAPVTIVPSDKGETSKEVLEGLTDLLMRPAAEGGMKTPMDMIIAWMTGAILKRRAYFEKVVGIFDGKYGYEKVAWRPPTGCNMTRHPETGEITGYKQWIRDKIEEVEFKKPYAMVYVHGQAEDPIRGVSDLDVAWWCYQSKMKLSFLWFSYLERQATPSLVVHGNGEAQTQQAVEILRHLRNNGVVGVPASMIKELQVLDTSGQGESEFQIAMNWLDSEAATSCLAGFMNLPSKANAATGSYALSKDSTDLFMQLQNAKAKEISYSATMDLGVDLVRWNWGKSGLKAMPKIKVGPVRPEDIETSLDLLKVFGVAQTCRVPDDFVMELVMQVASDLEMDLDKMKQAIDDKAKQLEEQAKMAPPTAQVVAAANVGANRVKSATQQQNGNRNGRQPAGSGSTTN